MKYILFLTFCLLHIPLFAQTDEDSLLENKRFKDTSLNFEQKSSQIQLELNEYIELYKADDQENKRLLEAKCKTYLFQLFDLSLKKKEQEIIELQNELKRIGKRDQNIDKFNDLIEIKEEIDGVRDEIFKRKKNRDKIVEIRLKEILT